MSFENVEHSTSTTSTFSKHSVHTNTPLSANTYISDMEKDLSYHNLQYASKLNENNVSISFVPTNSFFQGFTQVFLLVKPECNQMFVVKNVTPPDANHTAFSLLRHEKDDPSSGLKFTPVFQTRDFDFSTAKLEPVHQNTPVMEFQLHCDMLETTA